MVRQRYAIAILIAAGCLLGYSAFSYTAGEILAQAKQATAALQIVRTKGKQRLLF